MANPKNTTQHVLLGALLGTLLAGTSASFLHTKTGKKIKRNVSDKYHEYYDHIEDFLADLKNNLYSQFDEKMENQREKASHAMDCLKEELEAFTDEEHKDLRQGLLIGAVIGCLLGIGGTALFEKLTDNLHEESFGEQVAHYAAPAKKIIKEIFESVNGTEKPFSKKVRDSDTLEDILDFASNGLKVWKKMKAK